MPMPVPTSSMQPNRRGSEESRRRQWLSSHARDRGCIRWCCSFRPYLGHLEVVLATQKPTQFSQLQVNRLSLLGAQISLSADFGFGVGGRLKSSCIHFCCKSPSPALNPKLKNAFPSPVQASKQGNSAEAEKEDCYRALLSQKCPQSTLIARRKRKAETF